MSTIENSLLEKPGNTLDSGPDKHIGKPITSPILLRNLHSVNDGERASGIDVLILDTSFGLVRCHLALQCRQSPIEIVLINRTREQVTRLYEIF